MITAQGLGPSKQQSPGSCLTHDDVILSVEKNRSYLYGVRFAQVPVKEDFLYLSGHFKR